MPAYQSALASDVTRWSGTRLPTTEIAAVVLAGPLARHIARDTGVTAELRTLAMAAEEVALDSTGETRLAARAPASVATHQLLVARGSTRLMTTFAIVVADAAVARTHVTAFERCFTLEWTFRCVLFEAPLHEDVVGVVATGDAHALLALLRQVVNAHVARYLARVIQIGATTHLDFFGAAVCVYVR